eukprot:1194075-Prorocentrum_minimum.AAC.3
MFSVLGAHLLLSLMHQKTNIPPTPSRKQPRSGRTVLPAAGRAPSAHSHTRRRSRLPTAPIQECPMFCERHTELCTENGSKLVRNSENL